MTQTKKQIAAELKRIAQLEAEGLTTSDAQAVIEAEQLTAKLKKQKTKRKETK